MATETSTKLTYDDYVLLPNDGRRYEILDGELYVNPAPNTKHQNTVLNLVLALGPFIKAHRLGSLFLAPYDTVMSEYDVTQPDLVFVSQARAHLVTGANLQGAPDLVIEVLSPSTRKFDETIKYKRFDHFGVSEYWLVDPENETVRIYRRAEGRFAPVNVGEALTSPLLPGFSLPMSELFSYAP